MATTSPVGGTRAACGDVSRGSGPDVGMRRSIFAGEVRRSQDHLAQLSVGRLKDPADFHHRLQVRDDEIHGLVAPREGRVADLCLDPFDDGGFELHEETPDNQHG